jgi:hypothetical protein
VSKQEKQGDILEGLMKAEIDGDRLTVETGPGARQAALDNIAAYFREREAQKSKRLLMIAATVLAVVAALAVVFAPQGREVLAQYVGAALVLLAAGAAGYSQLWLKGPLLELRAGQADSSEKGPS